MKKFSILTGMILLVALAQAAVPSVAGSWKLSGSISDMPVQLTCTFGDDGGKLSGVCVSPDIGELKLTGQQTGETVTWQYDVSYQGQEFTVVYTGKLEGDKTLKGDISVMGQVSGSFSAERSGDGPKAE